MTIRKNEKLESTPSSGNVFADLGLPNSGELLVKAELARQINTIIEDRGWTQEQAAEKLGIDQPKVSALSCGRLRGFSVERLIDFLNKLDRDVDIIIKLKPVRRKGHGQLKVAMG